MLRNDDHAKIAPLSEMVKDRDSKTLLAGELNLFFISLEIPSVSQIKLYLVLLRLLLMIIEALSFSVSFARYIKLNAYASTRKKERLSQRTRLITLKQCQT